MSMTGRKCVPCLHILTITLSPQNTVVSVYKKCLEIQMCITLILLHHTYAPITTLHPMRLHIELIRKSAKAAIVFKHHLCTLSRFSRL